MGMDVYGKNPQSETGRYFRRNVWGWRPLWDYVIHTHPEIAELVEYGHSNDGDGLNEEKSLELSNLLMDDLSSGLTKTYVNLRNKALSELPMDDCEYCNATGIRTDEVGIANGMPERELEPDVQIIVGREKGYCNGCNSLGKKEHWATNYFLDEDDIKDFAEFLKDCGGFEIW